MSFTLYNILLIVGILFVSYSTNVFDDTFLMTFFLMPLMMKTTLQQEKQEILLRPCARDERTRIMDAFQL